MNGFFTSLKLESECEQNLDWTQMIEISEAVECGKAPLGVVVLVGEILADEFDFKPLVDVSHTCVEIEIAVELVAVVLDVAHEGTGIDFPLVGGTDDEAQGGDDVVAQVVARHGGNVLGG